MNTLCSWIVLLSAFAAALFVVFLLKGECPLFWIRRRGVFAAALVSFVALLTHERASSEAPSKSQDQSSSSANSPNSTPTAPLPIPPELAGPGKWTSFKAFWRDLDRLTEIPAPADRMQEQRCMVESDKLYQRLAEIFGYQNVRELDAAAGREEDRETSRISKTAVKIKELSPVGTLLGKLAVLRVRHICGNETWLMTRLVQPTLNIVPYALKVLEKRIDTLWALKQKGIVKNTEVLSAMHEIQRLAYVSLLLERINIPGEFFRVHCRPETSSRFRCYEYLPGQKDPAMLPEKIFNEPQFWLSRFEQDHKGRSSVSEGYSERLNWVKETEPLLPQLDVLLEDLER